MNTLSFAAAQKVSLTTNPSTERNFELPFDEKLKYNRVISSPRGKVKTTIYSINPNQILRQLSEDKLNDLVAITLNCANSRNEYGMWDVLFNLVSREGLTACIFLAGKDYAPITPDRIVSSAHFLNLSMAVSRTHLNQIQNGDKIGIGICDLAGRFTYALLYSIEGFTTIKSSAGGNGDADRPQLLPAANCRLEHMYRVDDTGDAEMASVKEDSTEDPEIRDAFVNYLVNSANNIKIAYPWKPHFLPQKGISFDRDTCEARVGSLLDIPVSGYDDFETACRVVYDAMREDRQKAIADAPKPQNNPQGKKPRKPESPKVPIIEVVTLEDYILATVPTATGGAVVHRFPKDELTGVKVCEKYLTNADLAGGDLTSVSGAMVLNEGKFGKNAVLRYLTLNF